MLKRDALDEISEHVIGCAIEVHRTLGPGLLESIYQECLCYELHDAGLVVESGRIVNVDYKGRRLRSRFVLDLLVANQLIVEIKAVDAVLPIHKAQVITYLKLTGRSAGLLINFNHTTLVAGVHRLDHPARYEMRKGS